MPAREIRLLALTRVRSSGISRGTVAARATPYALEQTRQPSTAGYNSKEPEATASAATRQHRPRTAKVPPIAQRRPCENRSRNGPISGATTENGSMVSVRNSATGPRALPGSAKKMVPASEIATAASPAALNAWSSISRASPEPPAPWAWEARRARRSVDEAARLLARPVAATPRRVARSARRPRPGTLSSSRAEVSGCPRSGCGAVAGSTAPSCQVARRHAGVTRHAGEPS